MTLCYPRHRSTAWARDWGLRQLGRSGSCFGEHRMTSGPISLHPLLFPLYVFFANWLLVLWLLGLCWTWIDSRRRLGRTLGRIAIATLGIVPIAGPLLYALLRPTEPLSRRKERARMRAALERLVEDAPQPAAVLGLTVWADAPAERDTKTAAPRGRSKRARAARSTPRSETRTPARSALGRTSAT